MGTDGRGLRGRMPQRGKYRTDDVGGVFLRTSSTPRARPKSASRRGRPASTWSSKASALYTYACFFLCGLCLTYPWNAINAAVGALSEALGKSAYVYIQAAYYLPLLPCLLLQTRCDAKYDAKFGLRTAYGCRFLSTGVGLACAVGMFLPFGVLHSLTLWQAVAICGAIGMAQSLAFGAACQCAARFDPRAVMVFTCGYQSSPCVVLLLTLATGGAKLGGGDLSSALYWVAASGIALIGVLVLTAYLCMNTKAAAVLAEADARMGLAQSMAVGENSSKAGYAEDDAFAAQEGEVDSLLSSESEYDESGGSDGEREEIRDTAHVVKRPSELSAQRQGQLQTLEHQTRWWVVFTAIWPSVAASYVSFGHGLLVVCLLPYVPAAEKPGVSDESVAQDFAERLVFINLFSNLIGRLLSLSSLGVYAARSPARVLALAFSRLVLLIPVCWYIFGSPSHNPSLRHDRLAEGFIAGMVVTAGFLASIVYSSACAAVPRSQRALATLLVNIGMTLGIWSGIVAASALIA